MEEKDMLTMEETNSAPIEEMPLAPSEETVSVLPAEEEKVPVEAIPECEGVEAVEVSAKKVSPEKKKKIMIFAAAGAACALIAFLAVYLLVIKPNGIYEDARTALLSGNYQQCEDLMNQIPNHADVPALRKELETAKDNKTYADAEAALNAGNLQECERLMNKIPDHEKVPALRIELDIATAKGYIDEGELDLADSMLAKITGNDKAKELKMEIQYLRAAELLGKGEIEEAALLLEKIPNHADPQKLREKLKYKQALAALEIGDYETAYANFSELGDYEDAAAQKDTVYYEALAFKSLFAIQSDLKDPSSMRVTKVDFYKSSNEGGVGCVHEITGSNSYGGNVGGYVFDTEVYEEENNAIMISQSTYNDPDDYYEYLAAALVDAIKEREALKTTVDVARMNRLLEGKVSFKIDLPFQSGAVVES